MIFVRPDRIIGSAIEPVVFDGRRQVLLGKAVNDSWFVSDLAPGEYRVCAAPTPQQAAAMFPPDTRASTGFSAPVTRLKLEAGKTTFIRVDVGWESFASPRVELVPLRSGSLAEERARDLLSRSRSIEFDRASPEFSALAEPGLLRSRYDACLSASSDDLRLSTAHDEG